MSLFPKLLFAALCTAAVSMDGFSQAAPTASAPDPYSGFSLPTIGGSLRYSLTAAETVLTGYNGTSGGGANTYTSFSGNLAYLSHSQRHPFSAVYSGGYLIGSTSFPSYFYQTLSLSQVLATRNWNFVVGDSVDYTPQTPVGTLSGIPGTGDLSLTAVQVAGNSGLGLLTTYATRVGNTVSATAGRKLTGSTTLSLSGAYALQRYTGSSTGFNGIDNDQQTASLGLQHRLNARSSVGASYSFGHSSFQTLQLGPGKYGYRTHSVQANFTRHLNRKLTFFAGVGPQWVMSSGGGGLLTGTSASVAANASLIYAAKNYNAGINYLRGVNNGNGVVVGSRMDSLTANISHPFKRMFNVSGLVGYNHSAQLTDTVLPNYNSSGVVAGGQLSVQIRQPLSVFAGYTLQRQLFNGFAPSGIAFNGLTQFVSFGITYSPKAFYDRK